MHWSPYAAFSLIYIIHIPIYIYYTSCYVVMNKLFGNKNKDYPHIRCTQVGFNVPSALESAGGTFT